METMSAQEDEKPNLDKLRLHIVSAHANSQGLKLIKQDALRYHFQEHNGPGGIRNHPMSSLDYDADKVVKVLTEESNNWVRPLPKIFHI